MIKVKLGTVRILQPGATPSQDMLVQLEVWELVPVATFWCLSRVQPHPSSAQQALAVWGAHRGLRSSLRSFEAPQKGRDPAAKEPVVMEMLSSGGTVGAVQR